MQLDVLNDLAKAKRRWTEKKLVLTSQSGNFCEGFEFGVVTKGQDVPP